MTHKPKILLTENGVRVLKEKLEKLEEEYAEVSRGKMEAAEQGGNLWHDNPAFEEVEQRQIMLAHMIAETQDTLKNAEVVETQSRGEKSKQVEVGCMLEIRLESGSRTIRLGDGAESDPSQGVVSYLSPLGQAVLGAQVGEEREYTAGNRTMKVRVLKIKEKE